MSIRKKAKAIAHYSCIDEGLAYSLLIHQENASKDLKRSEWLATLKGKIPDCAYTMIYYSNFMIPCRNCGGYIQQEATLATVCDSCYKVILPHIKEIAWQVVVDTIIKKHRLESLYSSLRETLDLLDHLSMPNIIKAICEEIKYAQPEKIIREVQKKEKEIQNSFYFPEK